MHTLPTGAPEAAKATEAMDIRPQEEGYRSVIYPQGVLLSREQEQGPDTPVWRDLDVKVTGHVLQ